LANGWFIVLDSKSIDASKSDAKVVVFAENHRLLEKTAMELFKNFRDHIEGPLSEIRNSEEFKLKVASNKPEGNSGTNSAQEGALAKLPPVLSDGEDQQGTRVPTLGGLNPGLSKDEVSGGSSSGLGRFFSGLRRKSNQDTEEASTFIPRESGKSIDGDTKSPPTL
jgi:hypothetical protein